VLVCLEVFLQPQDGFEVEVVGRLVQEQEVWLDKEGRGQGYPHPPPPAQIASRGCLHFQAELETIQDGGSPKL